MGSKSFKSLKFFAQNSSDRFDIIISMRCPSFSHRPSQPCPQRHTQFHTMLPNATHHRLSLSHDILKERNSCDKTFNMQASAYNSQRNIIDQKKNKTKQLATFDFSPCAWFFFASLCSVGSSSQIYHFVTLDLELENQS